MPRYELVMITKALERPETVTVVKRAVQSLLNKGAIVRQIENLGERKLPYIMRAHSENFTQGRYFVVEFDGPTTLVGSMTQLLKQDLDIIRPNILKKEVKLFPDPPCPGMVTKEPNYYSPNPTAWFGAEDVKLEKYNKFDKRLQVRKEKRQERRELRKQREKEQQEMQ
ncbi:28S ribosomal protein S6, mitochondrial-like [Branchiostoma floridae]|uniref:Small ribosomal subunit protein bS6m n=1 Tax=Branchiostoma floridae TaxID=7739 RepID=A0A9J7MYP8_BRAFL|nr:28S ribosomal protein S6, mitochondrial-like [Branchiostoma floridae]